MSFAPGEAYQFDWSHETISFQGMPLHVKANLCVGDMKAGHCARISNTGERLI